MSEELKAADDFIRWVENVILPVIPLADNFGKAGEYGVELLNKYRSLVPNVEARHAVVHSVPSYNCPDRLRRMINHWNSEADYIYGQVKNTNTSEDYLKWNCLIWQEAEMWSSEDKVTPDDFAFICDRRGFDTEQRKFLYELIKVGGLVNW